MYIIDFHPRSCYKILSGIKRIDCLFSYYILVSLMLVFSIKLEAWVFVNIFKPTLKAYLWMKNLSVSFCILLYECMLLVVI